MSTRFKAVSGYPDKLPGSLNEAFLDGWEFSPVQPFPFNQVTGESRVLLQKVSKPNDKDLADRLEREVMLGGLAQ